MDVLRDIEPATRKIIIDYVEAVELERDVHIERFERAEVARRVTFMLLTGGEAMLNANTIEK